MSNGFPSAASAAAPPSRRGRFSIPSIELRMAAEYHLRGSRHLIEIRLPHTILRSCRFHSGREVEHAPAARTLHTDAGARCSLCCEAVTGRAADLDERRSHLVHGVRLDRPEVSKAT